MAADPMQAEALHLYRSPLRAIKKVSGQLIDRFRRAEDSRPEESSAPRLLVVDDEDSIRFSMKDYFSLNGFSVDTARDLDEAERLIQTHDYKVVVQDLRIGGNNHATGLEVVRLARRRNPATAIVVLTAYGSAEAESEARRSGADAFLRKPQPLSQVAQVVRGLIESPRKGIANRAGHT